MAITSKEVTIKNEQGLHARPAALFVQTANKYDSAITVKKGRQKVNGKSIMGILMLAAGQGVRIIIEADGDDAAEAVADLEKILNKDE
jgi:phosphocarrier protein HPr